jgi:hypothetical protein
MNNTRSGRICRGGIFAAILLAAALALGGCLGDGSGTPAEAEPDAPGDRTPETPADPGPEAPTQPLPKARRSSDDVIDRAIVTYLAEGRSFTRNIQPYEPLGDYLNFAATRSFGESTRLRLDPEGLPTVLYADGQYHYNPVTLSQFALALHGRLRRGEEVLDAFRRAADKLVSLQDDRGAFRYDFAYRRRTGQVLEPGWVSGMAQGQALSALARAAVSLDDPRYREAGDAALAFLEVEIAEGGPATNLGLLDPALSGYRFFEEYPTQPPPYTLNGYMFALLGLYDWSHLPGGGASSERAGELFWEGVEVLEQLLPYFDVGGFTTYDLHDLTHPAASPLLSPGYHAVHVYLLHALQSITRRQAIAHYRGLWSAYVVPDPAYPPYLAVDPPVGRVTRGAHLRFYSDAPALSGAEYQFSLRDPSGEWEVVSPYGETTAWEWGTGDEPLGTYFVRVEVRPKGATQRTGSRVVRVDLQPAAPTSVSLAYSRRWADDGRPAMVFQAAAVGGEPPIEHRYWLKPQGGAWTLVRDFAADANWVWIVPEDAAPIYYVQVDARSAGALPGSRISEVLAVEP